LSGLLYGSLAVIGCDVTSGVDSPCLLTARTRNWYEWPSIRLSGRILVEMVSPTGTQRSASVSSFSTT